MNSVFAGFFFWKMSTKCSQNHDFCKRIFGHSAGSTKLDRPHCKHFWEKRVVAWPPWLGVARGILQGRPLQLPMGWGVDKELTKSWPTYEQLCVQNLALAISCCFSRTKSTYEIRLLWDHSFPLEHTKSPHPENPGKLLKAYNLAHPGPVLKITE